MSENKFFKIIKTTPNQVMFILHSISNPSLSKLVRLTDRIPEQTVPADWALDLFLNEENYQGNAVVNYTEYEVPYTRIIEHKHFEYGASLGKQAQGDAKEKTIITREYPDKWSQEKEPYYPINNEKNNNLYEKYKECASQDKNIIFGGRLGQYKYYDMDKVIESALQTVKEEL